MYLHLGRDAVIRRDEIIGVFDMDNTTQSYLSRDYLTKAEKNGQVINIAEDLPKSFIVTNKKIYLSQLSSTTLIKRADTKGIGIE